MSQTEEVRKLVNRFEEHVADYTGGTYNETQVRREFIDPLFRALGWDIDNRSGVSEAYKDVIHEDAIKIGGATKAPDYCFRIGGSRKFFLEAKKPSVNIEYDRHPAYQLRRYAWSAKLPLSVLTDFEEFAVYDCRIRPNKNDKASKARLLFVRFDEFLDRWDEIADLFSKAAVLGGALDEFSQSDEQIRGVSQVNDAFLAEIQRWRSSLASTVAKTNQNLNERQLNFVVQRNIDRIVFLRICEDRGIEPYGRLGDVAKKENAFESLLDLFYRADERYDSGLFHFQDESGRPSDSIDTLTPTLSIPNKILKDIISNLYYPDSPYEFSVLPADILGQVYEQFLGQVIRLTATNRAKVEDKPEVRKAGGVYYTPSYVVDYIVRESLVPILSNRSVGPRSKVSKLKILDASCGSGSFLIGAYQFLLDWHLEKYLAKDRQKWSRGRAPKIFQSDGGEWKLTAAERKRILVSNIFGVDIDPQAVEVTKLSLLLKMLEGESEETLQKQFKLFEERVLPELGNNVKCGNSLIASDYFSGMQGNLLETDELFRVNAFDWEKEFPDIMAGGGFDVVLGNPPWGASFSNEELAYLRDNYPDVIARMIDSYIYFLGKSYDLVSDRGYVGMILPSTILNQVDARPIRSLTIERGLTNLVNLGQGIFGAKVLNTSTIAVSGKPRSDAQIAVADLSHLAIAKKVSALSRIETRSWKAWKGNVLADSHLTFFTQDSNRADLLNKLRSEHGTVADIVEGKIQRGVSPDVVAAHVLPKAKAAELAIEEQIVRIGLSGPQIKAYQPWQADQAIIYTDKDTDINRFPNAKAHLSQHRDANTCKEVEQAKHPWWRLHRPRNPEIFRSPKIIGLTTTKRIELLYDESDNLVVTDAMYVFHLRDGWNAKSVMAVMQSNIFLFLYRVANQGESRVIPQIKATKLYTLPVPIISEESALVLESLVDELYECNCQLADSGATHHEKSLLQRTRESKLNEVEVVVGTLYGLSTEELGQIGAAMQ